MIRQANIAGCKTEGDWDQEMMMPLCPNCDSQQPGDAKFCEECGFPIAQTSSSAVHAGGLVAGGLPPRTNAAASFPDAGTGARLFCAHCGAQLAADSRYCDRCGAAVGGGAHMGAPAVALVETVTERLPPALRVIVGQHQVVLRFPEGKAELVWGRNDPVGGIIPDFDLTPYNGAALGVSRQHVRILYERGRLYIEDQGSTNLTHLQGGQLAPYVREVLHSGDEIRLGRLVVILVIEGPS